MSSIWQSLWQAAAIILSAGFTVAACYSTGVLALHYCELRERLRRTEYVPLSFVLGASILHLAVFAILALHVAFKPVIVAVVALPIAMALRIGAWRLPAAREAQLPLSLRIVFGLCFAVFFVFYFVNAL